MKHLYLAVLLCVGCQHFTPDVFSPAELDLRQEQIKALEPVVAEVEERYQRDHQVDGVSFVSFKRLPGVPLHYGTDRDNAIFTGMYLAAASYRYGVTQSAEDLAAVKSGLEGVYMLTHVSGTPGVLARWVFPLEGAWAKIGYDRIKSAEHEGNLWGDLFKEGQMYERGDYAFHTRTTKDQLCGIVMGLAVAFKVVDDPQVQARVAEIVEDLNLRFQETGWSLRDHQDKKGTSASKINAPLRLALEALYYATSEKSLTKPSSMFFKTLPFNTFYYNRSITRTFAFNLRAINAHSLWVLRDFHKDEKGVRSWEKTIWRFMAADDNPHFAALHSSLTGEQMPKGAWENFQRRVGDTYYKFFSWQKDPDEWWPEDRITDGPGLDILLPYWMMRYYTPL
jgi:hypothetical protein